MANTYISLHQVSSVTMSGTKSVPLQDGGETQYVTLIVKLKDGSVVELSCHIEEDFRFELNND
jgi:hypothetical protein